MDHSCAIVRDRAYPNLSVDIHEMLVMIHLTSSSCPWRPVITMAAAAAIKAFVSATVVRHHSYYRQVAGMSRVLKSIVAGQSNALYWM